MGCRPENRIERICLDNIPVLVFLSTALLLIFSLTTLASPSDETYYGHIEREKSTPSQPSGTYVRYYKLYNRCSGKHVSVKGRIVQAKAPQESQYAWLRVETVSFGRRIQIRSNTSHSFLCFTANGTLTVKHSAGKNRCFFHELHDGDDYTQFQSSANEHWFIGFNRNGRRLAGNQWRKVKNPIDGKRCFQFMRTDTEPPLNHPEGWIEEPKLTNHPKRRAGGEGGRGGGGKVAGSKHRGGTPKRKPK